jgi:SHS2 domain-containing protein
MVDTASIRPVERSEIRAEGGDWKSLLVSWLGEILYRVEAEKRAFMSFHVSELSPYVASGWGVGEPLDPARHLVKMEIKAPTYHMLELKEENGRWLAQIIFDV